MVQRVLVALDESPQARAALRRALKTYPEADIVVVHVSDPREWSYGSATGYGYHSTESYERAQESAAQVLAEAESVAAAFDREVTTISTTGKVARAIVACVEDYDVDQIVMGSHGRRGLSRYLLGSVAEEVIRRSPVSVTIVREASDVTAGTAGVGGTNEIDTPDE